MKKIVFVFIVFVVAIVVAAEEIKNENKDTTNNQVTARKRIHKFGGFGLSWIAGLHALGVFVAIKFKLFLIALAIGASIIYGIKFWAGSKLLGGAACHEAIPYIREAPYIPYEHHGFEHSGHDSSIYSSYPGPPQPYSNSLNSFGPSAYSETSPPFSHSGTEITSIEPFRRRTTSNQKRDINDGYEWGDVAFTFLGVNSQVCRKRFVCEMGFKSKVNPISKMAYKFISENFFGNYRSIEEKPKTINDCARMYSDCEIPEEVSEDVDNLDHTENIVEDHIATEESPPIEQLGRLILRRSKKN